MVKVWLLADERKVLTDRPAHLLVGNKRAVIKIVWNPIIIRIRIAGISYAVTVRVFLIRIGNEATVVNIARDPVVIHIRITGVANPSLSVSS